jgi:hypothetical protein
MNTSSRIPPVAPELTLVPPIHPAPQVAPLPIPIPRPRAANANAGCDAEQTERHRTIADLYANARKPLTRAAIRVVGSAADADDVVHEAFAVLLADPRRKPTRSTVWCIVRDLARGRRAELAMTEPYVEGDAAIGSAAGAWLEEALGGRPGWDR